MAHPQKYRVTGCVLVVSRKKVAPGKLSSFREYLKRLASFRKEHEFAPRRLRVRRCKAFAPAAANFPHYSARTLLILLSGCVASSFSQVILLSSRPKENQNSSMNTGGLSYTVFTATAHNLRVHGLVSTVTQRTPQNTVNF